MAVEGRCTKGGMSSTRLSSSTPASRSGSKLLSSGDRHRASISPSSSSALCAALAAIDTKKCMSCSRSTRSDAVLMPTTCSLLRAACCCSADTIDLTAAFMASKSEHRHSFARLRAWDSSDLAVSTAALATASALLAASARPRSSASSAAALPSSLAILSSSLSKPTATPSLSVWLRRVEPRLPIS